MSSFIFLLPSIAFGIFLVVAGLMTSYRKFTSRTHDDIALDGLVNRLVGMPASKFFTTGSFSNTSKTDASGIRLKSDQMLDGVEDGVQPYDIMIRPNGDIEVVTFSSKKDKRRTKVYTPVSLSKKQRKRMKKMYSRVFIDIAHNTIDGVWT